MQHLILDSAAAAERITPLLAGVDNLSVAWANGTLGDELRAVLDGESDVIVFSTREDWLQGTAAQLAAIPCQRIRLGTGDVAELDGDPLAWLKARIRPEPYKSNPTPPAPSDVAAAPPAHATGAPDGVGPPNENPPLEAYTDYAAGNRQAFAGFIEDAAPSTEWPVPVNPFSESNVPEFDYAWVPAPLVDYVHDVSQMTASDPGLTLFNLLGFSTIVTDEIKILVRRNQPDYKQSARLWLMLVAPSGAGKTPSLAMVKGETDTLSAEINERVIKSISDYKLAMEIYDAERRAYVAGKAKGTIGLTLPEMPTEPAAEQLVWMDTTVEALAEGLKSNPRGSLTVRDEIIGWANSQNQYKSGGSDRQTWLQSYDGGEAVINRVRGKVRVQNFAASIIGGTQPAALRIAATTMALASDGLIQRFNVYISHKKAGIGSHADANREAALRWRRIARNLYYMKPPLNSCFFTPEAQEIQRQMELWTVDRINDESAPDSFREHASKWRGGFARYCLLYHLINEADANREVPFQEVGADIAGQVFALFRQCLYPHAQEMYCQLLGHPETNAAAIKIAEYLLAHKADQPVVTLREIAQGQSSTWQLLAPAQRKSLMATLNEWGWIEAEGARRNEIGLPTRYRLSPKLSQVFAELIPAIRARRHEDSLRINAAKARRQREPGED